MSQYSGRSARDLKLDASTLDLAPLRQAATMLRTAGGAATDFATSTNTTAGTMVDAWTGEAAGQAFSTVTETSADGTTKATRLTGLASTIDAHVADIEVLRSKVASLPATDPPRPGDYLVGSLLSPFVAGGAYWYASQQAESQRRALVQVVEQIDAAGVTLRDVIDHSPVTGGLAVDPYDEPLDLPARQASSSSSSSSSQGGLPPAASGSGAQATGWSSSGVGSTPSTGGSTPAPQVKLPIEGSPGAAHPGIPVPEPSPPTISTPDPPPGSAPLPVHQAGAVTAPTPAVSTPAVTGGSGLAGGGGLHAGQVAGGVGAATAAGASALAGAAGAGVSARGAGLASPSGSGVPGAGSGGVGRGTANPGSGVGRGLQGPGVGNTARPAGSRAGGVRSGTAGGSGATQPSGSTGGRGASGARGIGNGPRPGGRAGRVLGTPGEGQGVGRASTTPRSGVSGRGVGKRKNEEELKGRPEYLTVSDDVWGDGREVTTGLLGERPEGSEH